MSYSGFGLVLVLVWAGERRVGVEGFEGEGAADLRDGRSGRLWEV